MRLGVGRGRGVGGITYKIMQYYRKESSLFRKEIVDGILQFIPLIKLTHML